MTFFKKPIELQRNKEYLYPAHVIYKDCLLCLFVGMNCDMLSDLKGDINLQEVMVHIRGLCSSSPPVWSTVYLTLHDTSTFSTLTSLLNCLIQSQLFLYHRKLILFPRTTNLNVNCTYSCLIYLFTVSLFLETLTSQRTRTKGVLVSAISPGPSIVPSTQ